jgi:hypothetical protein
MVAFGREAISSEYQEICLPQVRCVDGGMEGIEV